MKKRAKQKPAQPKTVSRWTIRALENMSMEYPEWSSRIIGRYKQRGAVIV